MNTYTLKNLTVLSDLHDSDEELKKVKETLDRYSNRLKKRCVIGGDKCDVEFYIHDVTEVAGESGSDFSDIVIDRCEVTTKLELNKEEVRSYAEQTIQEAYASIKQDLFAPEYE